MYSTAQRKGKRIPREIRARAADRMLIIRGSMMVNLRVTTASPRQIHGCMYRGSMYRGSARISYCIRASQYSTSSLHVGYTRVCTVYSMCVRLRSRPPAVNCVRSAGNPRLPFTFTLSRTVYIVMCTYNMILWTFP